MKEEYKPDLALPFVIDRSDRDYKEEFCEENVHS